MGGDNWSIYDCPIADVTFDAVSNFVRDALESGLVAESLTVEFKERRSGANVAEAVAAMANTDGGVVLLGVADQGEVSTRLVGVPAGDFDRLVDHLRALLSPLPDIIPVAIPGADQRIVIVLRVDADRYLHPVVVGGKVVYRVPGATVPADRQRVLDLARRSDRAAPSRFIEQPSLPINPGETLLWDTDPHPSNPAESEVRVSSGLLLPPRVVERPWLDTPARDAAVQALEGSRIPGAIWPIPMATERSQHGWRVRDRRSTWLSLGLAESDGALTDAGVRVESGAHLSLVGRRLTCVVGVRLRSTRGVIVPLSVGDLHRLLLAEASAVRDVCNRVASAVGASEPTTPFPWIGWVRALSNYRLPQVVTLDPFPRDGSALPSEALLVPTSAPDTTNAGLNQICRDWLTVMLLDLGVRDFEGWLDELPEPE